MEIRLKRAYALRTRVAMRADPSLHPRTCVAAVPAEPDGVVLTSSSVVYDLPGERVLRGGAGEPLVVPEGSVVVMGSRPAAGDFARQHGVGLLAPVIVTATLGIGNTIVLEAGLSFLGLGPQPPTPSWGNMVAGGKDTLLGAWWEATFPGLTIVMVVLAFNLVGDGLRDALDPRLRT